MIIHRVTNTCDAKRDILSNKTNSWKNKADKGVISSYSYIVNNLGQRTSVSTEGEAFSNAPAPWAWNYDVLGQVIKANNYDYSYDSIGNRKTSGKDNSVLTNYTSNNLNQYTAVNTNTPICDNEGNLLSGLSKTTSLPNRDTLSFVYNAENRPVKVKQGEQTLEEYSYDHGGRRVKKGNSIIIYDGYNAIAEYDLSSKALKETYAWGNDMVTGAGGVGGLLSVTDYTRQTPLISYPTYDGNGNISEYLTDTNNGAISSHYEYDAFGNVIKKTGDKNYTYQFSTKPYDTLTCLNYYNFRLYDPASGRWINRDPIQEQGGLNLYNFVGNNTIDKSDKYGLISDERLNGVSLSDFTKNKDMSGFCEVCFIRAQGFLNTDKEKAAWARFAKDKTGEKIDLSEEEVKSIATASTDFVQKRAEFKARCQQEKKPFSEAVAIAAFQAPRPWGLALGTVALNVSFSCECSKKESPPSFKFSTSVSIKDRYDFDPKWFSSHRDDKAEWKTRLVAMIQPLCGWTDFDHEGSWEEKEGV